MTAPVRASAILILLAALAVAAPPLHAAEPGTWSSKAPLSGPRENHGVIALDGRLLVVGGNAGAEQILKTEEYDTATDRWRLRAPMPFGSHHLAVALLNGKIYTFGGFTAPAHGASVDVAFEYDPKADSWRALPKLSGARGSPAAVGLNGKVHVIGGRGGDNVTVATHEAFDPATGQWTTLAPLSKARDHIGLIVVAGKIHAIGGRLLSTNTNQSLHEVYDPATNAWSAAAPMPTPRSSLGVTEYRGMIVVVGGEGDATGPNSAFKDNEGYDLKTGQWVKLAPVPPGRHGLGAATLGDHAYFVGGSSTRGGAGVTAEMLAFTLP
jgi:N-acetylneuraminic acid mutarotase